MLLAAGLAWRLPLSPGGAWLLLVLALRACLLLGICVAVGTVW